MCRRARVLRRVRSTRAAASSHHDLKDICSRPNFEEVCSARTTLSHRNHARLHAQECVSNSCCRRTVQPRISLVWSACWESIARVPALCRCVKRHNRWEPKERDEVSTCYASVHPFGRAVVCNLVPSPVLSCGDDREQLPLHGSCQFLLNRTHGHGFGERSTKIVEGEPALLVAVIPAPNMQVNS